MSASDSLRILRQHVRTDQLLGVQSVPLGNPARFEASTSGSQKPRGAAGGAGKAYQLDQLDHGQVRSCTRCDLCRSRTQTVFGEGDVDATLMFVGEGPGQREDQMGRPFVGRAGELLDKQIKAMRLERSGVYIANIVKCRPPRNRTPSSDEVLACSAYLHEQIRIVGPTVIVALGAPATRFLLQTKEGIMALRGQWSRYEGLMGQGPTVDVMPTYHPAFLLRQYTTENRKKVWSDLQKVAARLGLG